MVEQVPFFLSHPALIMQHYPERLFIPFSTAAASGFTQPRHARLASGVRIVQKVHVAPARNHGSHLWPVASKKASSAFGKLRTISVFHANRRASPGAS